MKHYPLIVFALLAGCLSTSLHADGDWQRCNKADVKALKVFTVGEAALYRKNCDVENLLSPPLKLSFRYFREVPGDAFGKAAMHFLEKNLRPEEFARLKPDLADFNSHYQDVDDGDQYLLTYSNDGLTLTLNGKPLTYRQGRDFASAYLTIWFGPRPYSDDMKETLLGSR